MISFVIPVYNYDKNLAKSLDQIRAWIRTRHDVLEVIFVDDGSTDGSAKILNALESPLRVLSLNKNVGKGAAVRAGVLEARGDHIFFTDIDLPYDFNAVDLSLKEFEKGADMVSGSRYMADSAFVATRRADRQLSSKIFAHLANTILLEPVADTQCGIKGFTRDAAQSIFTDLKSTGYIFDVEVFYLAQHKGLTVGYVPVTLLNDSTSSIHLLSDGARMATHLGHLYVRTRTSITRRDITFIATLGGAVAILLLPMLQNVGALPFLEARGFPIAIIALILVLIVPIALLAISIGLTLLPLHKHSAAEFSRYAVVGIFNTALNTAIFNSFILITGISQGPLLTLFALITFAIVITQSFFWNVFWTFHHMPPQNRTQQYRNFFLVTSCTALVNLAILHVVVNVIGPPAGISTALWANVALLFTIATAIIGNFLGYKFFVFAK